MKRLIGSLIMLLFVSRFVAAQVVAAQVVAAQVVAEQDSNETESSLDWVYLQNGELRVGLLRSHGGAIGHLSARSNDFNVLNHYDHGRLIQQSYYGDEDGSLWAEKLWRFNPVQGGDYQGKAAVVLELTSTETSAYVKTTPRHWASGELLSDCVMEQWLDLEGPVLKVRYRFVYGGGETYKARHQETPAVFVSPQLSNLVFYSGDRPWTNDRLTSRIPKWPNEYVTISENWAAYVNDEGQGLGVYVPGSTEATCYRYEANGDSDCSYIAPLRTFALTPELTFTYSAFFTLGDVETIRARFEKLHRTEE